MGAVLEQAVLLACLLLNLVLAVGINIHLRRRDK
jgi:hypothetical protein